MCNQYKTDYLFSLQQNINVIHRFYFFYPTGWTTWFWNEAESLFFQYIVVIVYNHVFICDFGNWFSLCRRPGKISSFYKLQWCFRYKVWSASIVWISLICSIPSLRVRSGRVVLIERLCFYRIRICHSTLLAPSCSVYLFDTYIRSAFFQNRRLCVFRFVYGLVVQFILCWFWY
jgi:hypothetical protein